MMAALPVQGRAASASTEEHTATVKQAATASWSPVSPGIWRTTIGRPEKFTPVSSRLVAAKPEPLANLPSATTCPIGTIHSRIDNRGTVLTLPLQQHESIYGFGLQFFSMEHRGKKRVIRVNADPRADTGESHAPIPFFVSTLGYGVLVDTARYAEFNCGNAQPRPTKTNVDSSANTDPAYTESLEASRASQILVEIPDAPGVDVYVFAGPSMMDAVRRYNLFSGGGFVPPEWGLGFWYRADSHSTQQSIESLAAEFRERKMPCDVIGLEPGWQTHAYSCTFLWNRTRFPDPAAFVKKLAGMDMKVNLWEHAFTHPSSPIFDALRPYSGDIGVWGGLVPDFAAPKARRIFGEYHARAFLNIGISGFKLDECDGSDYTGGWSFPSLSHFPSGVDGEQMHSVFGLRYQHAIWEQFLKRKQETYCLVRSSGTLAAPYPFVLYSDLYDHRQFIRGLVNSGFSGMLWCPEVRDAKSEEDLIRRLQSAVFSPLAMINGWYIANPPWKQLNRERNNANELMDNWQDLEAKCRKILGWRMQLIPYLRSSFACYAADGTPPFRALLLDSPNDPALLNVDDEYMVGDRMLVAPLFAGEAGRKVVLPAGIWHDFWTGKSVQGESSFSLPASTEKIPVYVKAGSVLPMATVSNSTADAASRELTVCIFGDGSLPFSMQTPQGDSLHITWNAKTHSGSIDQRGNARPYKIARWKQMNCR